MEATGASLPDIVVVVGPGMWQAGLAKARMREGQIILERQLAHDRARRLDPAEFPATLVQVIDGTRRSAEYIGPEEHELIVDFGHCSPVG